MIFLAAVLYFVLAAETLRINAVLRKQVNQLETKLAQVQSSITALDHGTKSGQVIGQLQGIEVHVPEQAEAVPSIGDLKHRLQMVTRLRGPVWRNVAPSFNPQTGAVTVNVEAPQPSGIQADTIVFAFEQGPPAQPNPTQGAQYLGEFRVTKVAPQQAELVPVLELDQLEKQRIANSRGPWVLYETMPVDQLELFAGLTEEQLRQVLPAASVEEYIRQGSPAGPDDDEWHVIGYDEEGNRVGPDDMDKAVRKVYQRRLRDYATEFADLNEHRVIMLASIDAVKEDNKRLAAARTVANNLQAFRTEEKRKLVIDLAGVKKERQIIEKHLSTVQRELATARKLLDQAIAENRRLADELTQRETQRPSDWVAPAPGPLAVSQ